MRAGGAAPLLCKAGPATVQAAAGLGAAKVLKKSGREEALKSLVVKLLKIGFPFALGLGILWWMYRDTDWAELRRCVLHEMKWGWMALSLLFGILPQTLRAWRWRMALAPLGERPRTRTCVDAIFLSYASSLVIPRVGEVTRCGTLKTCDGTSFTRSLGTVVTERLVDSLVMLLLTALAFFLQLPVFVRFLDATGTDLTGFFHRFTTTGYLVTAVCLLAALGLGATLLWRFSVFSKGRDMMRNLWAGIVSLRGVKNLPLYLFYSVAIWVAYYLHFYIAFFCFDFTSSIDPIAAFLIFCVGSFAVLVPTPNGAGPWHFAVKTMLVLYGVAEAPAVMFALVVHTIQTALVVLLGAYAVADLGLMRRKGGKTHSPNIKKEQL